VSFRLEPAGFEGYMLLVHFAACMGVLGAAVCSLTILYGEGKGGQRKDGGIVVAGHAAISLTCLYCHMVTIYIGLATENPAMFLVANAFLLSAHTVAATHAVALARSIW